MELKQFIQEEVAKLHKITLLKEEKTRIEKCLKEWDNYQGTQSNEAHINPVKFAEELMGANVIKDDVSVSQLGFAVKNVLDKFGI